MKAEKETAADSEAKSSPRIDLVVPVLNEAHVLEQSVVRLREYLRENMPYTTRVLIADNGSTDGTDVVGRQLEERFDDVSFLKISGRGRGRALRAAWTRSQADIVAYTDVDLSTDLKALQPMVEAIHAGGYDIAIGSRLMKDSEVVRGPKREFISRAYNWILRTILRVRFSDAQCGFKAVSRQAVRELVPKIEDESWFFDTELLVKAERSGYRIKDVPAHWVDDEDSRVKIIPTAWEDLKGVARLRRWIWSEKRNLAVQRKARAQTE